MKKLAMKFAVTGAAFATAAGISVIAAPQASAATPWYGAIAINTTTGRAAVAINEYSPAAAQNAAINKCGGFGCEWVVTMDRSCGAAAQNPYTRQWGWAYAPTLQDAKNRASNASGGGNPIVWGCTIR